MNTLPIIIGVLCVFAIGYRYYSAFIAAKALVLDDRRQTPAHAYADGHNYVASPKWVLFGHHFAAVDTGTRVARYVLQELMGKAHKPLGEQKSIPGNLIATTAVVGGWGYMIYTGSISTIWPLFGTGNQLLATIALAVVTTFLINMGKVRYAAITAVPMLFVGITTITAGVLSIWNIFWPMTDKPGKVFQGYLDSTLMAIFILGVVIVVIQAGRRCYRTLHGERIPAEAAGPPVLAAEGPPMGCC